MKDPGQWGVGQGSRYLNVTTIRDLSPPELTAAQWHAGLLGYSARYDERPNPTVAAVAFLITERNGSKTGSSGWVLDDTGHPADLSGGEQQSRDQLDTAIRHGLAAEGLTLVSLNFDQVGDLQVAPVIVAKAPVGSKIATGEINALTGLGTGKAPVFLELLNAHGTPILATGQIPAAGQSMDWNPNGCHFVACEEARRLRSGS